MIAVVRVANVKVYCKKDKVFVLCDICYTFVDNSFRGGAVPLARQNAKTIIMNKTIFTIIAFAAVSIGQVAGQTYTALWNQEKAAESKDLPRTQIEVLGKIQAKAAAANDYGQLLKAEMKSAALICGLSGDSLPGVVDRLTAKEQKSKDAVLRAVYSALLYKIYAGELMSGYMQDSLAARYKTRAVADVKALAATKISAYEPFVVKGYNASVFGSDMLSVIGYETCNYETMHHHYSAAGMRPAACITALDMLRGNEPKRNDKLKKSAYIKSLDSLINVYSDLDIVCEAAIERFKEMSMCSDVTTEDKISYINNAISKWGGWQRANVLREEKKQLTAPSFGIYSARNTVAPDSANVIRLSMLRNISSLTMNVYKVNATGETELSPESDYGYRHIKPLLKALPGHKVTRDFIPHPDYMMFDDSLTLAGLPAGVYMLEFQSTPVTETIRKMYYVTSVYTLAEPLPGKTVRYVVVDAVTGQPLPGAKIKLTPNGRKSGAGVTLTCNAQGETKYKYADNNRAMRVFAYTAADKYSPAGRVYDGFYYNADNSPRDYTTIFTDRRIYRPGQTVRLSAVTYKNTNGKENNAVVGETTTAVLRDANYKVVAERQLVTDKYGSCSADFVIPTGSLTGTYTIKVGNGTTRIRVEEYKRPTFGVEFPPVNEKYAAGDTLVVRAKALSFAGVAVQGAKVRYTVRRDVALWWRSVAGDYRSFPRSGEILRSGGTVTADDGTFAVEIPLTLPDVAVTGPMHYNFVVTADVTDAAGETQNASMTVRLGTKAASLTCDLADKVQADSLNAITFKLYNAAGMTMVSDMRFYIDNENEWQSARTGEPTALKNRLASGRHRLFAVCDGDTIDRTFTVFGLDDTVPCAGTRAWFYTSAESFPADGSPVTLQVGSSDKDVHIVYSIISGDRIIESGSTSVSNALINRKFTYKEEYGDGLRLVYAWVKNGRCHDYSTTIKRPLPDKRLRMKWTTFRDRLTPGQSEEWRLSIMMPDGKPADARLTATLYDKALDKIKAHRWNFTPVMSLNQPYSSWQRANARMIIGGYATASWKSLQSKVFDVGRFDISRIYMSRSQVLTAAGSNIMYKARGSKKMMAEPEVFEMAENIVATESKEHVAIKAYDVAGHDEISEDGGEENVEVQMRENFSETAFFQPDAVTDKDGNVTLAFTLPESLTTWRFIGMAYTPDMYYGTLEGEAVATKDIMVQPNMPRFVRVGDRASIAARVSNTGTAAVTGTVRMELIDPDTEKTVYKEAKQIKIAAGATTGVAFDYSPNGDNSLLICRISVSGKNFSDGEQHYLPVLPNRERVTVTMPFTQNEQGTKVIDIAKLMQVKGNQSKLTIEYANNPAWMVVQALPYAATPRNETVIDRMTAVYANTVAGSIIKQNPKIKTTFEQWNMERGAETSLMSALDKNAELKDIILAETPWVADADREEEQKRRIVDLFDESQIAGRTALAVRKLAETQNPDGSWGWCPGMQGSMYITVTAVQMYAQMKAMTGNSAGCEAMMSKAFNYMDGEIVKMVREMKEAERKGVKPGFPGNAALQYLYASATAGHKPSAATRSACDYLVALLKKDIANQSIYAKALTAIILAKRGETLKSREYVQSLKEYTVYNEEMGRYYDTRKARYSWCDYKIPTEVAAIEAIRTVTPNDDKTIDEMRRWLLQQKRTQAWNTPINSVNAVYAFLFDNTRTLATGAQAVMKIDGTTLELPTATAGMGYVKTTMTDPKGRELTITKTSEGTSWGAVYAQFMQKTSEVGASGSGMSVKREIVLSGKNGKKGGKDFTVGDRVTVRITIEASRDFDFVQITDRRAACMEPVEQLSGYRNGAYISPKDNSTNYYLDILPKGKRVIETEYYIDRAGSYETGTCVAACAYAPEYRATAKSQTINVK